MLEEITSTIEKASSIFHSIQKLIKPEVLNKLNSGGGNDTDHFRIIRNPPKKIVLLVVVLVLGIIGITVGTKVVNTVFKDNLTHEISAHRKKEKRNYYKIKERKKNKKTQNQRNTEFEENNCFINDRDNGFEEECTFNFFKTRSKDYKKQLEKIYTRVSKRTKDCSCDSLENGLNSLSPNTKAHYLNNNFKSKITSKYGLNEPDITLYILNGIKLKVLSLSPSRNNTDRCIFAIEQQGDTRSVCYIKLIGCFTHDQTYNLINQCIDKSNLTSASK